MSLTTHQKELLGGGAIGGGLLYYFYYKHSAASKAKATTTSHTTTTTTAHQSVTSQTTATKTAKTAHTSTPVSHRSKSSSKSSSKSGSPYGNNPARTPRNCPSGYKPKYHAGYGWVCQETTAKTLSNLKTSLTPSCSTGIGVSATGAAVAGLTPYQQAKLALQTAQSKCGGSWGIYWQNGSYMILPASRVKYLMGIGGTLYHITSSGGKGSQVVQHTPASSAVRSGRVLSYRTTRSQEAADKYSGKISPAEAKKLLAEGKLLGPGWVSNGTWYQNLYQIPTARRASAQVN